MVAQDPQAGLEMITAMLKPWHASLANPAQAQEGVLKSLLAIYARTAYGSDHDAAGVGSTADYRRCFPVVDYDFYEPLIRRVMAGEVSLLLDEEPVGWAITRGTTRKDTKFIPMTPADLRLRVSAGRAMLNFVASTRRFDLFAGVNLNLNFPSYVGKVRVGEREIDYGYSSGIYTRRVSNLTPVRSAPTQDEIDALGGGKTVRDWHARFELAYEKCKALNVTLVGGVAPTSLDFARYLHKQHGLYPKDLWKTQIMTLGSVPGINTRLSSALHAL